MTNLDPYYQMLDLEPGASWSEINQAYKDLVFIWHPDRIPQDNERLHQKAILKLQEINAARDALRSVHHQSKGNGTASKHTTKSSYGSPKAEASRPSSRNSAPPRQQSTTERSSYSYQEPNTRPKSQEPPRAARAARPAFKDLSGADLQGQDFSEKDLAGRNLSQANLSAANLKDAFLHNINLEEANLQNANLFRANLLGANLHKANLRGANLVGADLSGADLSYADLTDAKIGTGDRVMVKLTGTILTGTRLPNGSVHQ